MLGLPVVLLIIVANSKNTFVILSNRQHGYCTSMAYGLYYICSKVMHSHENICLRICYVNKTCLTVLNGHNIFFFAKTGANFVFEYYKLLQFQHLSCYIFMFFILLITALISITLTIIYLTVYNVRTE